MGTNVAVTGQAAQNDSQTMLMYERISENTKSKAGLRNHYEKPDSDTGEGQILKKLQNSTAKLSQWRGLVNSDHLCTIQLSKFIIGIVINLLVVVTIFLSLRYYYYW